MTVHRLDAIKPEFIRDFPWKVTARCATTANVTIATALNAGDTIDGVTLVAGDRVLVKDQSTGSQNGIYVAGATPVRSEHMCTGLDTLGSFTKVLEGTANGGKVFACTNTTLPTIDTTALTFAEFGAGNPLTVQDEGTPLATAATTLNFVGSAVAATGSGATKTITVTAATTLDDLTDVTITSPATADRLRYDGTVWRNSALTWKNVMVLDPTSGNYLPVTTGAGEAVYTETL